MPTIVSGFSRSTHFLTLLITLLLTTGMTTTTHARTVAGVDIAESVTVNGNQLTLNGAGIRRKLFFKIYIGALYTKTALRSVNQILSDPNPKRIHMHFLYDEVSSKKLQNGWQEGFENNNNEQQMQELQSRLDQFNEMFVDMRKDNTIEIDFNPSAGVSVTINHQPKGNIAGQDFMHALLRVWLGEVPADSSLKEAMLSGSE